MYPIWEPFMANSTLIAVVAILHVFVSHFAVGGGLYLVLAEIWARRADDPGHLKYVERHSRFFALLTLVFGAVTGVGIWLTIGLIHPVGTKWLINNFVWGWATEWVFFFVEIAAALIYYYGWRRLSARTHVAIGWIYFIAAWASLAVINGILSFMLTPGQWLVTGNFWDGIFNPTYLSSTLFRTCISLTLAGLFAILTVSKEKDVGLKIRIMRRNGLFVLGPMLAAIPCGWWYYASLPAAVTAGILPGSVPELALQVMLFTAGLLFLLTLLSTIIFPRHSGYISAGVLLLLALLSMGGFEWAREAVRKPFIITDFLYSSNLLVTDAAALPATEPMAIALTTGDRGRDLYLNSCRSCHTRDGYHGLADRLAGLDREHIVNIIPRLHHFTIAMPPFAGNDDDAGRLADYLMTMAAPNPLVTETARTEAQKADLVFARRCGGCHSLTGQRAIGATFEGIDREEAADIIAFLEELADGMPPFTGSDEELQLLITYLTGGGR